MELAILNTSIVTAFGSFKYEQIEAYDIGSLISSSDSILSAIRHESTAQILTELLGIYIPVNRIQFSQEVEQQALVFKLNGRPPEGKILNRQEIEEIGYEFGLLTRLR